jgi:4-hydroxy-tetrahydrodipicolinate synthase
MFDRDDLKGIIPPIATPLTPSEEVDVAGMRRLVDYVLDAGVHGLFVLGATGEFAYLRDRERVRAIETAVEAANGRVPVMAGISDAGTKQVIEHCLAARRAGADFVACMAPYYSTLRQPWIYEHFRAIACETGAPLLLYNVPPVATPIEPETIARLAEIENVVGMKDSGDFIHIQDVLFRTRGRDFRMLSGLEYHLVAALQIGARGGTPSPSNIWPQVYVEMYDKTISGKVEEAFALQERSNRFVDLLDAIPSWTSTVKAALHLMGICGPTVAAPAPSLSIEEADLLRAHLARYHLL